ncbi:hypothetical protein WUBG_06075 [Wuchereria bancrofti]|uniref:Uncharacterized protein n=1 Tax=Wuchereria bancrofti TaxID=6293 RepID=J9ELE4_WUCBA|nr:hypothetical protein WUBG_06075 [Wuchereria bancrofti]
MQQCSAAAAAAVGGGGGGGGASLSLMMLRSFPSQYVNQWLVATRYHHSLFCRMLALAFYFRLLFCLLLSFASSLGAIIIAFGLEEMTSACCEGWRTTNQP